VYDLIWVFNMREHARIALDAYREQGHSPNHHVSLAHLDEQLHRALKRLGR